ncbi:hypothetical protein PENSPDRAFT_656214 [Peniophora sp. CONT]|nr:hypothetical protein PENSPDRAFT_656214 [Peniophora sp. CONT]
MIIPNRTIALSVASSTCMRLAIGSLARVRPASVVYIKTMHCPSLRRLGSRQVQTLTASPTPLSASPYYHLLSKKRQI